MSKLHKLTDRMGDLVARRVDLRLRCAHEYPSGALALLNETAELSEEIGKIQIALADEQGRILGDRIARRRRSPEDYDAWIMAARNAGAAIDLLMASGGEWSDGTCVECMQVRPLDANNRCSECARCVAGATA